MRVYLATLAVAVSLVGFVTASPAGAGSGGSSSGGASAGTGSGGGGGSGHGGGGGAGGAHGGGGGHGGGNYSGGAHAAGGHAGLASLTREGPHGSYGVVGYASAGLSRSGAAARDGHMARSTLVLGPRTGSAATARRVTDHRVSPMRPHKPRNCANGRGMGCESVGSDVMPLAFCPPGVAGSPGYRVPGCPGTARPMGWPAR